MEIPYLILTLVVVAGFYTSFMGGANDLANSFGTSVGSKALTLRGAVVVAACAELAGAVLVGAHVTDTVRKGIVDPTAFASDPRNVVYGMLGAILAAGLFLQLATHLGLPVSSTHSTVGAVLGFGLIAGGIGCVSWAKMGQIVASWFVSPISGGVLAFILFHFINRNILDAPDPARATRRIMPWMVCIVISIIVLSFLYKGLKNLRLHLPLAEALPAAGAVGLLGAATAYLLLRRRPARLISDPLRSVENQFKYLQVLTACYVAFAHGANDVANGIGPVAAIFAIRQTGEVAMKVPVATWILALGGFGIVCGLAIFGANVIRTIGERITEVTPSRGFAAEFAAATTVLVCSKLGMPISTTHTLVGAVIGVALARGIGALDLKTVRNIFASWAVTLPATIVLSMIFYWVLMSVFSW